MVATDMGWYQPPADIILLENNVHVWFAWLEQSTFKVKHLKKILSTDEQIRAERFHFEQDRNRFIIGRGTLRTILGYYLGMEPSKIQFCYSSRGKPYLAENFAEGKLNFNLSHSHDLALYAFTLQRRIGIDLEQLRPISMAEQIAKRYFSSQENAVFSKLSQMQKQEAFINGWTSKEAYVKAIGEGLALPLNQIEVSLLPGEPAKIISIQGNLQAASQWTLQRITPASGYVATLVVEGECVDTSYWQCPELQ